MSIEPQYWPIEFLLVGEKHYYPGICLGVCPRIHLFSAEFT